MWQISESDRSLARTHNRRNPLVGFRGRRTQRADDLAGDMLIVSCSGLLVVEVTAGGVLHLLLPLADPRHHPAQLLADRLDLVLGVGGPQLVEPLAPAARLGDPLLGERAVLDLGED